MTMTRQPSEEDRLLGRRIRAERLARRLSQARLAEALGVTFQQVQKYESGTTRLTASRLKIVSSLFGIGTGDLLGTKPASEVQATTFMSDSRDTAELMGLWLELQPRFRKPVLAFVRAMTGER